MASGVIVVGISEYTAAIKTTVLKADTAARNIVIKGGEVIKENAKKEFRPRPPGSERVSSKTGRTYYLGAPLYPANPPRPTTRTGNLKGSISVEASPMGAFRWESNIGPRYGQAVRYAKYVEVGGARKFPYMEPGFDKSLPEILMIAQEEWRIAAEA